MNIENQLILICSKSKLKLNIDWLSSFWSCIFSSCPVFYSLEVEHVQTPDLQLKAAFAERLESDAAVVIFAESCFAFEDLVLDGCKRSSLSLYIFKDLDGSSSSFDVSNGVDSFKSSNFIKFIFKIVNRLLLGCLCKADQIRGQN